MKKIVHIATATLAITATLTCGTASADTVIAPDSGSALLAPLSFLAGVIRAGQCGSSCGAGDTAAEGSGALSELVTGVVTTGSGPALLTGSNDTAAATGSTDLSGLLLCGLISMSSSGGPTICDTGIVP